MRHRFKKYYENKLTNCRFIVGIFKNREKNCITIILPELLFKHGYHIQDITYDQYTRFNYIIKDIVNTYMKVHSNIHIDELPLGFDANNVIKSTYNGSNIKWIEVNINLYISHHPYIYETIMSKCVEVVKAYKKRHEIRQGLIDDKIQLNRYKPSGVYYEMYARKNEFDRNQRSFDIVQNRIDSKLDDITELTDIIKNLKKEIMKSIGKRDKKLLKYYLYLANKRVKQ